MLRPLITPTFKRALKRLHKQDKAVLDDAVHTVLNAPDIGEPKIGDLAGVRVYKFKLNRQLALLAYEVLEEEGVIKLLALGSHENFYRDLKR